MGIKRGTLEVGSIFRGSVVISKVYRGTTVIYELADGTFLELIEDITVAGSAVTSVQFSGFTATKEDTLLLVGDIVGGGANGNGKIYVNGNNTDTNYRVQTINAYGNVVTAYRASFPNTHDVAVSSSKTLIVIDIKLTNDGYVTLQAQDSHVYGGASLTMHERSVSSTFTMSSITQLDITGVANAIGIGSRFSLYKIVGV